jgi:hypothetical protein
MTRQRLAKANARRSLPPEEPKYLGARDGAEALRDGVANGVTELDVTLAPKGERDRRIEVRTATSSNWRNGDERSASGEHKTGKEKAPRM